MTHPQDSEGGLDGEADTAPGKTWRPSLSPAHRLDDSAPPTRTIIENTNRGGVLGVLREWVRRPLVRIGIGLSLFILAIIAYDATLNLASWTERAPKMKAADHSRGVPRRPDGS